MYRVILYGCGIYFKRMLPDIRHLESIGFFQVLGVSGRDIPAEKMLEGYPLIPAEELYLYSFDYLLLMSEPYVDEMIREIPEKYGIERARLIPYPVIRLPGVTIEKYLGLRDRKITIFSNNCWGGFASKSLYLEHCSPFKNLWLCDEDYLKFIEDPEHYLHISPVFGRWKNAMGPDDCEIYPVLYLDDIELLCNHDTDPETAIQNWNRRAAKVNLNNVLAVFSTNSPNFAKIFLNRTRFQKRYCFTNFESGDPRVITLIPKNGEDFVSALMWHAQTSEGPCTVIDMLTGDV